MEESKDSHLPNRVNQSRVLPNRVLKLLMLFLALCFIFSVVSVYMIRYFGVSNLIGGLGALKASVQTCVQIEESVSLERLIEPPSDLIHSMSDKELFWRATFAPRLKKYPFNRVPKIAFMFLTKGPLPLAPLWERFFKGHDELYSIYIHPIPSYESDFPSSSVFYKRRIPSQVTEWGKMSMGDAERRLLANALLDINNEWFVLVSESCIPLHNFTIIYNYIRNSKHSFVDAFDDPGPYGRGRYSSKMEPVVNITQWRKGSQWFEVNRELAIYMVQDTKFYPIFDAFCKPHCYVDEHYFPTMLTIRAASRLANRTVTWTDWSRGGAHPATFGRADITERLMKRILENNSCIYNDKNTSICHLFARKFAPGALEPLFFVAHKYLGF